MLWRMSAALHDERFGTMAYSGYSPPATNVSATNVSRLAQMGSGNCANPVAQTSKTSKTSKPSKTPSDPSRRSTRRPDRAMVAQRHRRPRPEGLRLRHLHDGLEMAQRPGRRLAHGRPAVELGFAEPGRHVRERCPAPLPAIGHPPA